MYIQKSLSLINDWFTENEKYDDNISKISTHSKSFHLLITKNKMNLKI